MQYEGHRLRHEYKYYINDEVYHVLRRRLSMVMERDEHMIDDCGYTPTYIKNQATDTLVNIYGKTKKCQKLVGVCSAILQVMDVELLLHIMYCCLLIQILILAKLKISWKHMVQL